MFGFFKKKPTQEEVEQIQGYTFFLDLCMKGMREFDEKLKQKDILDDHDVLTAAISGKLIHDLFRKIPAAQIATRDMAKELIRLSICHFGETRNLTEAASGQIFKEALDKEVELLNAKSYADTKYVLPIVQSAWILTVFVHFHETIPLDMRHRIDMPWMRKSILK